MSQYDTCMGNTYRQVKFKRNRERWVAIKRMYTWYRSRCKAKTINFDLEIEEFEVLISDRCHYCNKPPPKRVFYRSQDKKVFNFSAHEIDRVDNNLGYSIDNCVPCCSLCNSMKSDLPKQVFLNHSKRIVRHQLKPRPEAKKC